jgi:hypothetical protein
MKTVFLRALEELNDKESILRADIRDPESARGRQRFEIDIASFSAVPRSPFAYWVSDRLRGLFTQLPPFEAEGRTAKQGLATADDFRFVRAWWAVPPQPVDQVGKRWFPFAKGGNVSPFYADIYLMVNWDTNGAELDSFGGSVIRNPNFFFRPGLTWPLRTKSELSLRSMPAGCIFGHKGPAAFDEHNDSDKLLTILSIANSKAFRSLVEFQLAAADARRGGAAHSYEVGILQRTPIPCLGQAEKSNLAGMARRSWSLKRSLDTRSETSHALTSPRLLQVDHDTLIASAAAWAEHACTVETELATIQAKIDERCFELFDIDEADRRAITEGFGAIRDESGASEDTDAEVDAEDEDNAQSCADTESLVAELVSWAVGVAFGRFDIRVATGVRALPLEPEPFDPLPVCSPGMLTGDDGLPLSVAPSGYPIAFPENGILVDDPGHGRDLTAAVRGIFDELFGKSADVWWNDVAASLNPKDHDLRAWLASNFFEHHLKRYCKSRRKAPILWQLSTPSGRYSIWLYAQRLTRDSFFQLQNDVVGPKLAHEERQLTSLAQSAGRNPSARERKEIDTQEGFVEELRAMLDEVKRVAPLWNPSLDDGVVLTMAPLWRLVPQHKPWQKELKSKWDELATEKYDWAHVAMHLWPERVVPKCATDRSLVIAHSLEEVFWIEGNDGKWKPRPAPTRPVEELVRERTSIAVKAALKSLLEAPVANVNGTRGRGRRAANAAADGGSR